ncbi:MAG: hypothetical protein P8J18_01855 [Halieaceae bacterium]|nr:hypothetical protein [Halieaceae bacterium]
MILPVLEDSWVILEGFFVLSEPFGEGIDPPSLPGKLLLEELEELEELEVELWPFFELVEGVLLLEPLPVLLALLPPLEGIGIGIGSETDTPEFDGLDGGGETHPATRPTIPIVTTHFLRLPFNTIK